MNPSKSDNFKKLRDKYIKELLKNKKILVAQYGKDAEKIMYGRAIKMVNKELNKK